MIKNFTKVSKALMKVLEIESLMTLFNVVKGSNEYRCLLFQSDGDRLVVV